MVTAADGIEATATSAGGSTGRRVLGRPDAGLDRIEVMHELKREPRFTGVPIVALTAHALQTERDAFLAKGFDAVISKPCLPEDVVQLIERLLSPQSLD